MLVHDSSSLEIQFIYIYWHPRRDGSLTVHEQSQSGSNRTRRARRSLGKNRMLKLMNSSTERLNLFIQLEQQEQLAVQNGLVCMCIRVLTLQ